MKVIHNYPKYVGITSQQSIKRHPFNIKNSSVLIILCMYIIVLQMYLIYSAPSLKDCVDCIYLMITVAATALNFAFINWKMAKIFRFIDNLEMIVKTSKFVKLNLYEFLLS